MQLESLDDLLFRHLEDLDGPAFGPMSGMERKLYDAHARLIQAMSDQRDVVTSILAKLKPVRDAGDEAAEPERLGVVLTK